MLALALIGWGERASFRTRLRQVSRDLVTLIFEVAVLLVWAGFVEAFLSQYHEPIIPYWVKITFGLGELVLLFLFLSKSGRGSSGFPVPSSGFEREERSISSTRNSELGTRNWVREPRNS